eukprot:5969062-Prymnesium_polylepis.1
MAGQNTAHGFVLCLGALAEERHRAFIIFVLLLLQQFTNRIEHEILFHIVDDARHDGLKEGEDTEPSVGTIELQTRIDTALRQRGSHLASEWRQDLSLIHI